MPEFTEEFELIGPRGKKSGTAFVDTGATFTVVPDPVAQEIGLQPYRGEIVDTNNGPVSWGVARAQVGVGGKQPREQDVFVSPGSNPLAIGAESLQVAGFHLQARSARARLSVCMGCDRMELHPYLGPKCTACGCLMRIKTAIPSAKCPLGYW
jgi:predicted aspartyl protease